MKKLILGLIVVFSMSSCDELLDLLASTGGTSPSITQSEAASGLKQALEKGVLSGTSALGQKGGFLKNAAYKILIPSEVQDAVTKIKANPITNALASPYLTKVETAMNEGAENAMAEAKPIFVNAIKSMSITDAIGIVTGGKGAGTEYLKRTTSAQLKSKFTPVIKNSLDKVNINDPWTKVTSAYNTVMGKSVKTDLNEYVTDNAMTALFNQINQEEDKIRANPVARITPLLKKVFGYADAQK
ncbi:MAG: DUF4197 domain-containing protein [Bacteroidetes bacterium]|jgi:hypothetical protein|nr:DUF4197 domain-containing protein [Bacteroidota bacterium]MDA8930150.1 DUF4197 domain-containing protein [Bacteroidia bacterium]